MNTPPPEDPRIAALEQARGIPFTEAQRAQLDKELKDLDEGHAAGQKFLLPDGGGEPCFVFQPLPRTPR
ncbi:MAG TPA: hypothetical protein VKT32_13820 [Chthonomonadaceae bacterium]|nr:hypothetical protein [Chthonomonadaceae bacterium]